MAGQSGNDSNQPGPGVKASLEGWEVEGEVPQDPRDHIVKHGVLNREVTVPEGLDGCP